MAIPIFKSILYAILFGCVAMSCNFTEASLVTNKFPMLTYAEQNVPTYDKPGGGQKGFISPEVALVYIKQIRPDGWAYGSYPIAGGKRIYRWFQMRELQGYLNYKNKDMIVESDQIVFRTSAGNSRLGSLKKNDKVIVIAERGDSKKIIYRVGGGNEYKMGWLTPGSSNSDTGSDNGNGENDQLTWEELLKKDNVNITINKIEGTGNQIIINEGNGDLTNTNTNITAGGNVASGSGATVNDHSYNDESVNKGAEINSGNTEGSYNTKDSGNTNVATDNAQIKKEQLKEEKMQEEQKVNDIRLEGGPPGINNKLGDTNSNKNENNNSGKTTANKAEEKKG